MSRRSTRSSDVRKTVWLGPGDVARLQALQGQLGRGGSGVVREAIAHLHLKLLSTTYADNHDAQAHPSAGDASDGQERTQ